MELYFSALRRFVMTSKTTYAYYSLLVIYIVLLFSHSAWGSPTGLNNIPTTDIVPTKVLVLQSWLNSGYNRHPQEFVGFKYGLLRDIEVGVDWKANDVTHGHATFQGKYAFDINGDAWRGVIGIADLSDNREHNGYFFPYAATSLDLKALRLHFGYAPQPHNEAFFGGFDKTVQFLDRNLQLRFDGIHTNDREDMLFSAGFLYELGRRSGGNTTPQSGLGELLNNIAKNVVLESWVSMPSNGRQETYTLKLNHVIRF
jgi:hypothetical protein